MPRYTNLAQSLPATVPFVGPETQERASGQIFRARLGANENIFGPSPKAIAAMAKAAHEVWKYGDAENYDLRQALARHHNVKAENIVVGEGIDALLGYLLRLLVQPGVPVVTSRGAYPTFNYHVAGYGGTLHQVTYRGDYEDSQALLAKATEVDAAVVYLANPDNPMGTMQSSDDIQQLIDGLPMGCLLVLDEAYLEFAPPGSAPIIDYDNPGVIRMRTFSKAYGMAGARIAYAIGQQDLISAFNKIRNHFAVSLISQAGALAALQDQDYLADIVMQVSLAKQRISGISQNNGLKTVTSSTNFICIDCGSDGGFAKKILAELNAEGIFARMPGVDPLDRCIRLSVGNTADLDLFEQVFPIALARARATS